MTTQNPIVTSQMSTDAVSSACALAVTRAWLQVRVGVLDGRADCPAVTRLTIRSMAENAAPAYISRTALRTVLGIGSGSGASSGWALGRVDFGRIALAGTAVVLVGPAVVLVGVALAWPARGVGGRCADCLGLAMGAPLADHGCAGLGEPRTFGFQTVMVPHNLVTWYEGRNPAEYRNG